MGIEKYKDAFDIKTHKSRLTRPYSWKKSRIVFVNSMSDLFHESVPLSFIKSVFEVMNDCQHHTFQVLTKRAERLSSVHKELKWTKNIWMGVSVENNKVKERISHLNKTGAKTKFLSCEPLIGSLDNLDLSEIDWVIVGGESGRKPRPMKEEWVTKIQKECQKSNTHFFFKQWGGVNKKKTGRVLNGRTYDDMPKINCEPY